MTKKLLICIASVLLFTGVAKAQEDVVGNYIGTLNVTVLTGGDEDPEIIPNSEIRLSYDESTETYTLSVIDFEFPLTEETSIPVGNLDVDGLERTEDKDNDLVIFDKEGYSVGNEALQNLGLGEIRIYLEGANIGNEDKELQLDLEVKSSQEGKEEFTIAIVSFTGTKDGGSTNLITRKENSLDIFYTSNQINVIGSEVNNYTIFGINGNMIEAGYIQNEQINIANIPNGVYFLQVGNKVAKFVK